MNQKSNNKHSNELNGRLACLAWPGFLADSLEVQVFGRLWGDFSFSLASKILQLFKGIFTSHMKLPNENLHLQMKAAIKNAP